MVTRAEWLAEGPYHLALGAGFFGFFSHTGLLLALEERGLLPKRVVGVSAGALAGGLWASGVSGEGLRNELVSLRREDFWDPGLPLGGLLRGRKFAARLRKVLAGPGISEIEQCRVPFAAVVHDVLARRAVVMDRGPIDVAIRASCTVPLMFRPILSGGRVLVDGGVSDRSGMSALPDGERVLMHYLPSRRRVRLRTPERPPSRVPDRPSMVLVTPGLPKVDPFHLDLGPVALHRTREHAHRWLDERV